MNRASVIVALCVSSIMGCAGTAYTPKRTASSPVPLAQYQIAAATAASPPPPSAPAPVTPAENPRKIAVLEIVPKAGFDKDRAELFNEFLQGELRKHGHSVIGRADIEAMLGLEKLKDALACDSSSCFAEIGGALGVDEIVTGAIGRLDPYLLITLKRLSPREGRVLKQATEKLSDAGDRQLVDSIGPLVTQLYGGAHTGGGLAVAPTLSAPAPEPAPAPRQSTPQLSAATGDANLYAMSQGVEFAVADEDEAYEVEVQTAYETFKCMQEVNFLRPCTLPIPPGPAVIKVPGKPEHKVVFEAGRSTYKMNYGSGPTLLYLAGGLFGGGALLLTLGLTHTCETTVNEWGVEETGGCAGMIVPAVIGGVAMYGGIFALVFGLIGLNEQPVIQPYDPNSQGVSLRDFGVMPYKDGAAASAVFSF